MPEFSENSLNLLLKKIWVNYTYPQILNNILRKIPLKNDNPLLCLCFVWSPWVWKSTIAKMISEKIWIYIASNDKIRRILESYGIDSMNHQNIVEKFVLDRAIYLLENHTNMIIDANVLTSYQKIEHILKQYNSTWLFIYLECSESIILQRLKVRKDILGTESCGYSAGTIDDYYNFKESEKKSPFPDEKIFFKIDTGNNVQEQVEALIEKILKLFNMQNFQYNRHK